MDKSLPNKQSAEQNTSTETSEEQEKDFSFDNPMPYGFDDDDLEVAMNGFNVNQLHERRI